MKIQKNENNVERTRARKEERQKPAQEKKMPHDKNFEK